MFFAALQAAAVLHTARAGGAWEDMLFMDLEDVVSTYGRVVRTFFFTLSQ